MKKTTNSLNNMKDTTSSVYNKAKNSSVSNRVTFAVAEKYGKEAMDNGKTVGTSMMYRFNPNGMKAKNIEQAVNGSVAGVPQSSQYYPRAYVATMSPTMSPTKLPTTI